MPGPELVFDCLGVRSDPYAAGPTLTFRVRIAETTGERVHAIALRAQFRIEPQKRRYSEPEAEQLRGLFGERTRWADTQRPLQFAEVAVMVPSFTGSVEVDVHVPCSYDMEVATGRYFHALADGEIPFLMMFSGTVFGDAEKGLWVEQVPWHLECRYRMPVTVWREMMDYHFPGAGWLMLRRDTISALAEFRANRALPTWDDAVLAVLDAAKERHVGQGIEGGS